MKGNIRRGGQELPSEPGRLPRATRQRRVFPRLASIATRGKYETAQRAIQAEDDAARYASNDIGRLRGSVCSREEWVCKMFPLVSDRRER